MGYLALRENLLFALDEEQQKALLALTPADLDGGAADWALALAQVSWLRREYTSSRSYGQSAADAYAKVLETWGQSAEREQVMMLRAYALAYAGQTAAATAEAERAMALERRLGLRTAYLTFVFARIYVLAGKPDEAIDQLEETLRRQDVFSRHWLRIDSTFAPLGEHPRFQRLISADTTASTVAR
jgi:predicted Zn-dependent protease